MKRFFLVISMLVLLMAILVAGMWKYRSSLLEKGIEKVLNQQLAIFFGGSLDVEGVEIDRSLRLSIRRIAGQWQAPASAFPLEVSDIRFEESLLALLKGAPVHVAFAEAKPSGSTLSGIEGVATLLNNSEGGVEIIGKVIAIAMEDLAPLDPEHLKGGSGVLSGVFRVKSSASSKVPQFRLDLKVPPPGGRLQARFFDLLVPYLPATEKKILEAISGVDTIRYQEGKFALAMDSPESVIALLSLRVPDYNLNLNLNLTFRVESQEVFLQIAELLGILQTKEV